MAFASTRSNTDLLCLAVQPASVKVGFAAKKPEKDVEHLQNTAQVQAGPGERDGFVTLLPHCTALHCSGPQLLVSKQMDVSTAALGSCIACRHPREHHAEQNTGTGTMERGSSCGQAPAGAGPKLHCQQAAAPTNRDLLT